MLEHDHLTCWNIYIHWKINIFIALVHYISWCWIMFFICSLKIFVPIALLAFAVLVPVNWTSGTLENEKGLSYDEIDKLSISNLGKGSKRCELILLLAYDMCCLVYLAMLELSMPPFYRDSFVLHDTLHFDWACSNLSFSDILYPFSQSCWRLA